MNTIFSCHGFKAYLVGGAVRDMLLGKRPKDFDIATNATPEQVTRIFRRVIPTGIAHGTVTVHFAKKQIEVTTFRSESNYSDARHPDKVEYKSDIKSDLARRDFTINAIALNLATGQLLDPFEGQKDIKNKIIKAVGNPHMRFLEDGLRPIRALRFCCQLDFAIQKDTFCAIKQKIVLQKIALVSKERFRDELLKMLECKTPSVSLKLMQECGILKIFMPELEACVGCTQLDSRKYHNLDVFCHCLKACDAAPQQKPLVRLAALLHDTGKVATRQESYKEGLLIVSFHGHEAFSVEYAKALMTRLHFSNYQIQGVCHLIQNHMIHYESTWSNAAVRRFLAKVGKENIDDLLDLFMADAMGKDGITVPPKQKSKLLEELKKRVQEQQQKQVALSIKDLAISGKDLLQAGIKAGPKMGQILQKMLEVVLDAPYLNTKEKLLEMAKSTSFCSM